MTGNLDRFESRSSKDEATAMLRLTDILIDRVIIGYCTNTRIEDLRAGRRVLRAKVQNIGHHFAGLVKACQFDGILGFNEFG